MNRESLVSNGRSDLRVVELGYVLLISLQFSS